MLKTLGRAAFAVTLLLAASPATAASKPAACGEGCLLDIASAYMDALSANDPGSAPVSPKLRSTENGVETPLTAGLWKTGTAWSYRHTFVDPVSGQIGVFGTVREGPDAAAIVALRLKVVGRQVTESELLVTRKGDFSLFNPDWAPEPKPVFKAIVPPDRRATRAQLEAVPMSYFRAIMEGGPELFAVHPDAVRVENGYQTTSNAQRGSPSISEGLRRLVYMQKVRQVRVPVVDVERGLVWGIVAFDMPVMDKTIMVRGKPVRITPEAHRLPRTLLLYELFKVEGGRVTAIEAVMRNAPLGADMGWGPN